MRFRSHKLHVDSVKRPWLQICRAGIGAAAAITVPAVTFAGLFYWTGDNGSSWNTTAGVAGTNWSSAPDFDSDSTTVPGVNDTAVFAIPGASNLSTLLGADTSIKGLVFTPQALSANPVTISGGATNLNTLTLGSGGIVNSSDAVITLSSKIGLGSTQTWTNNSTAHALSVTGVISGGATAGLTLSGPGAFNFSGANSFTGTTTLSTAGTALTLSGTNGALQTSAITLAGGSTLTLDNTAAANSSRLVSTVGITSAGGTLNLIGTSGSPATTQKVGTFTLVSGATNVTVTQGATLIIGSPSLPSLSRTTAGASGNNAPAPGGTVNFSPTSTGTINLANISLTNSLIGGWATIGSLDNSGALDFATVNGSGNVIPLASYASDLTSNATHNVKLSASTPVTSPTTINSLYLTANGAVALGSTSTALVLGSGGLISNGATLTIAANNNQPAITNAAIINSGGGTLTSLNGSDLIVTAASNLQINAVITGNIGLTKGGAGLLDLSNQSTGSGITNSYTGITTINGGTIKISGDPNLGAAPSGFTANAVTLNGGELRVASTSATNFALAANRGISVGAQGGLLSYTGSQAWVISQAITGAGGTTIFADPASNTNSAATQNIIQLANASTTRPNDYQGATVLNTSTHASNGGTGIILWGADNQIPDNSAVTVGDSNHSGTVIDLNGHSETIGSLSGSGNIQGLGGKTNNITNSLTVGSNNLSTTYSGDLGAAPISVFTAANNVKSSSIASDGDVIKNGTGTWTLSGASHYTGTTTINGGALLVGSGTGITSNASIASTSVLVAGGALGGNGTIAGAVTVSSTGILAPAMSATTTNTLTINNNLSVNGGTLDFNFGAAPATITTGALGTSDLVVLGGTNPNLSLNGTITLNVNPVSTGFGIGAYKLFDNSINSGGLTNTGTFAVHGSSIFNYQILSGGSALDASVGGGTVPLGDIYLEVLTGNPNLVWTGSVDGNWNTTTPNWSSVSATNLFINGSNVTFDDTASGTRNVTVAAGLSSNSITFNNSTAAYTLSGESTTVTGASGITKNQSGTVTLNSDILTPTVIVAAGTLTVGSGHTVTASSNAKVNGGTLAVNGMLLTPSVNVTANGALNVGTNGTLSNDVNLTVDGAVTLNNATQGVGTLLGSGSVTLNGTALTFTTDNTFGGTLKGTGGINIASGKLTLTNGGNTYSGATTIAGGTLVVQNSTGSATGTSTINVQSGGVLDGTGIASGPINVLAGGTFQGTGSFTGAITIAGTLSPGGAGTVGQSNLGSLLLSGGAILAYDIGGLNSRDTTAVTAGLTLTDTQILNLNLLQGVTLGDYTLFTAAGGITGTPNFDIHASGSGNVAGLTESVSVVGNSIVLHIGVPTLTWTGNTSNVWNFVDANWSTNPYDDSHQVSFTDSGNNTTITINAEVAPVGGMVFSNNLVNYSLSGQPIGGAGGITLNGSGSVSLGAGNTFTGPTVINAGTLHIADDSSLGTAPSSFVAGSLTIAAGGTMAVNTSLTLDPNRGIQVGGVTGKGATIDVSGAGTVLSYNGVISDITGQQGTLIKTSNGELDLGGANTFTGGLIVNGGFVKLTSSASGGAGTITVNSSGTLVLATGVINPITLNDGGALGATGGALTLPAANSITVNGNPTIDTFNPISGDTPQDVILLGSLKGSGMLNVGTVNGTHPDTAGLLLRGSNSSFSGVISVPQSGKLELMNIAANNSPAGTGTVLLHGGNFTDNTNQGTFSLLTLRNSFNGNTSFGNDVQIAGTGVAVFNLDTGTQSNIGVNAPAGAVIGMGKLTISSGQTAAVVSQNSIAQALSFSSVSLAGGSATFAPQLLGNTTFTTAVSLSLGAITETAPSSVIFNGASTTVLQAANSYTGSTTLLSGTTLLGAAGALPATTDLIVSTNAASGSVPTLLDLNNGGTSNDQTVSSLAGTITGSATTATITNSDTAFNRTLTVNQSINTSFAGALSGNLTLAKTGTGTLQLLGNESYTGMTNVSGGTLQIAGTLAGPATVTGSGSVLSILGTLNNTATAGVGGTLNVGSDAKHGTINGAITAADGGTINGVGFTRAITVQGGGTLAPGNGVGAITMNGNLNLSAPTAHLSLELGGTALASNDFIEMLGGTVTLGGEAQIAFANSGNYTPAIGDTYYVIVNLPGLAINGTFGNDGQGYILADNGDTFRVSYNANFFDSNNAATHGAAGFTSSNGHDVALQLYAVPEPGSFAAVISGLGMLAGLQRFRRRR